MNRESKIFYTFFYIYRVDQKKLGSQKNSNCSNSLNFEAKINFNTTKQNELKWRKTCTGLKFDLEHFNGPHIKFLRDSLYKHPVLTAFNQDKTLVGHTGQLCRNPTS